MKIVGAILQKHPPPSSDVCLVWDQRMRQDEKDSQFAAANTMSKQHPPPSVQCPERDQRMRRDENPDLGRRSARDRWDGGVMLKLRRFSAPMKLVLKKKKTVSA